MKKRIMILGSCFCFLAAAVLLGVTASGDDLVYSFFTSNSFSLLGAISHVLSFFASVEGLISITICLLFFLPSNKTRLYVVVNLLISGLVILVTKNIFSRPRPMLGQLVLDSYSFPSGHSFAATTFYGFLIYLISKSRLSKKTKEITSIGLVFFIICIAFSRVILGVHYVTDIIGGILLGVICLSFLIYFYEKNVSKEKKEVPFINSLRYAFEGIISTIKRERNMAIHFIIMSLVVIAGLYFQIERIEWFSCLILFGSVIALELVNTALENVVDLVTVQKKPKAKLVKDAAAGAVLWMAMIAIIVGVIIFLPKIFM